MNRLLATARCDVRLQFRNGFYYAAAFVAAIWLIGLSVAPGSDLGWLAPPLILSNLLISTYYFVAGLVLLEKGESTLTAQTASPLRDWEYLASKAVTLSGLALLENLAIVGGAFLFGRLPFPAPLPLIAGILLAAVLYTLAGFLTIVRYDTINEFLFPSFVYTLAFMPPFLHYFGLWPGCAGGVGGNCGPAGWLVYLHPVQAALVLLSGAFRLLTAWEWAYGFGYSFLWIGLGMRLCRRAFGRFVVRAEGAAGR